MRDRPPASGPAPVPETPRTLLAETAPLLPRRPGIPDPRREARWLLAAAWGVSEVWLRAHDGASVPPAVTDRFRGWVHERAAGAPAEHLTGRCRFCGRDIEVSAAVLVPRPETELLVEAALALPVAATARVVDVGTGSGAIAVTLAAERPRWRVAAVDLSPAALEVARRNARRHGVEVPLWRGDLAAAAAPGVDLVVANLPYIPSNALADLSVEVRREPAAALDGGAGGLDAVGRLVADLARVLKVCGGAVLELGEHQADGVAGLARSSGLAVARRLRDAGGCDRVVVLQPR